MINLVNQLWPDPSLVEQPETNFDIIFLHGLQFEDGENAWEKTWKQRRDSDAVCWPQEWLPRDLGKDVRVFSLSYDADVTRKFGLGNTESVADVGRNLRESLINRDKLRIGYSPFVLVGHCLGGLVIKALVVDLYDIEGRRSKNDLDRVAKKNAKAFREILRGIAFYGVPHSGSDFAKYAEWCTKLKPKEFSRLLMDVKPFRRNMEQLSIDFENTIGGHVNIYAFTEGLPTRVAKDSRSNKQALVIAELFCYNNFKFRWLERLTSKDF